MSPAFVWYGPRAAAVSLPREHADRLRFGHRVGDAHVADRGAGRVLALVELPLPDLVILRLLRPLAESVVGSATGSGFASAIWPTSASDSVQAPAVTFLAVQEWLR